ncbi:hypothetical protein SAMN02799624_01649 [Paenibacillus sp. UNC496MF]|uniref:hypothetical protein n=1 Tax=Paenibacillus sp. UNC496MF TaxID=1502753 RepID=UPI0008EB9BF3|nr:hypothetical protein [Paenibacillus sp. UNC496MF]SFI61523.1 hypothetical protein SAMN02799624_01649 [Paenibacillus sp. UNC496MF]
MEELLKLLFSNIYVVIIIAGILLSLLNKARGRQNPGGNRMPPFGGGPAGRPQARPQADRPAQPQRPQARPVPQQAKPRPETVRPSGASVAPPETSGPLGGSVYTSHLKPSGGSASAEAAGAELTGETLLGRALEAERAAEARPKPSAGSPLPASARPQPGGASFRAPRGQDLRQAFVMSEVLGPPRSKRPLKQK